MKRKPLEVYEVQPELCAGCLICQLRCSYAFHREFNPAKARLRVELLDGVHGRGNAVTFTEECTCCNLCVEHCGYGALRMKEARK